MSTVLPMAPPTRVILLDAAGGPVARWTLQDPERAGREFRWVPEGVLHEMGSGAGYERRWSHRGFRLELGLRWDLGLTSTRETWAAGAWGTAEARPTAEAHCEILDWSGALPVRVEPLAGQPLPSWLGQAYEVGPVLEDVKGVVHAGLELALVSQRLVRTISFVQARPGGWGIGPWGLMPWGK